MPAVTTILIGLGLASIFALAAREHRLVRARRHFLLDSCANILDGPEVRRGGDGFPSCVGSHRGRRVHVELIPDTMVLRRLPQVWLSVTLLEALIDVPSLAVLVRPAGYEFYSLTNALPYSLDTPATLPQEVMVRGSDAGAEQLLRQLTPLLAASLADPRVKEIAVTNKGLRIIWQAGEGRRGEHLLLRQAVFDATEVGASELGRLLHQLDVLQSAIDVRDLRKAA